MNLRPFDKTAEFCLFNYSCVAYEQSRLGPQLNSWPVKLPDKVTCIPLTGLGNDKIDNSGVLRLNVADDYNSLHLKTKKMAEWFLNNSDAHWLIKCDDDVWLSDSFIEKMLDSNTKYVGAYAIGGEPLMAAGAIYKIHRDLVEDFVECQDMVDRFKTTYEDRIIAGICLAKGELPRYLLREYNLIRLDYPPYQHKGLKEVDFSLCARGSISSLIEMYDYFDSKKYLEPYKVSNNPKKIGSKKESLDIINKMKVQNGQFVSRKTVLNKASNILASMKNVRK